MNQTSTSVLQHRVQIRVATAWVLAAVLATLSGCGSNAKDKHREAKYGPYYDEDPTSGRREPSNDAYFPVLDIDTR